MTKFELLTDMDASTGDVLVRIEGRISVRDIMRAGSHGHLLERLQGALDDAVEMWRRECR